MSNDMAVRGAIFDGDDTLWKTEILYDRAREAARDIVTCHGIDPDQWEARQRVLDVENVAVYGFSSARFPASCLQAFQELRDASEHAIDENVEREIVYAARLVFRESPELVPHVKEVLGTLRRRGLRLALLTKGDPEVQLSRIQQSGLASFFDAIEVVPEKTAARILTILRTLNVKPANTWVIGNSMQSDILPALALEARGIWIDAPVWEYERRGNIAQGTSVSRQSISEMCCPVIHSTIIPPFFGELPTLHLSFLDLPAFELRGRRCQAEVSRSAWRKWLPVTSLARGRVTMRRLSRSRPNEVLTLDRGNPSETTSLSDLKSKARAKSEASALM